MDLNDVLKTSADVIDFNTSDKKLVENNEFMMAWGIARKKALENIRLAEALLIIKKKYKITDFDFELYLENIDEEDLFSS